MQEARPVKAEIKARGQLTIPKKIRETSGLEPGDAVSIFALGELLIITRKRLELDEARREIRRILKESGLSAGDVLSGLAEAREATYRRQYVKKAR